MPLLGYYLVFIVLYDGSCHTITISDRAKVLIKDMHGSVYSIYAEGRIIRVRTSVAILVTYVRTIRIHSVAVEVP